MNAEVRLAFARFLLAMADDELVMGYRDTEWTGAAPMLEEDVALSSIGQDEVGHARLVYSLLHELTGEPTDYRARGPEEFLHAGLVERRTAARYDPGGAHTGASDWAFAVVQHFLYDRFDDERLRSLASSSWEPLAQAIDKVWREERYHLQHGQLWFDRLAEGSLESRERLEAALALAWPDALGLFEPVEGEELLVAAGAVPSASGELRDRWLAALAPALERHGLPLLTDGVEPRLAGRRGRHTAEWEQMWDEMTSVYRLDPAAAW